MMIRCTYCLAAAIAAVSVIAHPACADTLVLCIAPDGHIEIEASVSGSCGEDTSISRNDGQTTETVLVGSHSDEHCQECVDIPIAHGDGADSYRIVSSIQIDRPFCSIEHRFLDGSTSPCVSHHTVCLHGAVPAFCGPLLRSVSLQI